MVGKYLQVIWLYIIGIVIIMAGVYLMLLNSGPASFIVMLVGLGVAAMGAAHGKKMRMAGEFHMEEFMGEREFGGGPMGAKAVGGSEPEAPPEAEGQETEQTEAPKAEETVVEEEPPMPRRGGIMSIFRRPRGMEEIPVTEIERIEMEDIKSGKLVPTEADVIELVCPKCDAENDEKNFFCFDCGNKLRRKPSKGTKEEPKIAVEPGAIQIVGERRIAKVVVCPKCNAANKQKDTFCYKCGKKLKSGHEKSAKKKMLKRKSKVF